MMKLFNTNDIDLTGQVAVVTGGGRGLGRAMAQALSAAKAKVAIVSRTEAQLTETVDLIQQAGGEVLAVPTDITNPKAVEKMVQVVEQAFGHIDLLVNNAGVTGTPGPIWELKPEDWQNTFDVNVHGAFLCSAAILKGMVAHHKGRIINVASGAALGPMAYGSGYAVSKASLLRLTECIAADVKAYGIMSFAIDPGSVRTAMTEYLIESNEGRTYIPWYREYILAGGDVPAELSASLVTLLASGKLDRLSGRFIRVTDDIDQMLIQAEVIEKNDLYTLRLNTLKSEEE
jgi:NAD(P)-dependent dehydrogenase (short-subunit alcohol dehydrogenase family)